MKQPYISLIFACLFITSVSHAQFTKGTKTMDMFDGLSTSFNRSKEGNNIFKNGSSNANASGILGYFLNRNWLVGGGIGVSYFHNKNEQITSSGINDSKSTSFTFGYNIRTITRYYVKNTDKYGTFLFANTQFSGDNYVLQPVASPATPKTKTNNTYFDWSAGVGMHKMLNEQIAAEAIIYYSDNKVVSLNAYTRNFFRTLDKKNMEAPPQYIAQNRWLADGSLGINYATNTGKLTANAGIFGGKMLTDRWMLGSGLSFSAGSASGGINLSPFVRYYIPVTNRLFVFPFIGSSMYYYKQDKNKYANISFDRGIGYNYFLTRSMALSGTINANLKLSNNADDNIKSKRTSGNMSINTGLNYFF